MKLWRFLSRKSHIDNKIESSSQRTKAGRPPALLEPLEPRLLLSADFPYAVADGALNATLLVESETVIKLVDNNDSTILAEQDFAGPMSVEIIGGERETT